LGACCSQKRFITRSVGLTSSARRRAAAAAVFDGHGGAAASSYLQENLHAVLQRVMAQARRTSGRRCRLVRTLCVARAPLPLRALTRATRAQDPDAAYDSTLCARPAALRWRQRTCNAATETSVVRR
jgi:hypothetical protein